MAEFPELGSHCSVDICRKLDFLPVLCTTCGRNFCSDHAQNHGCILTKPLMQPLAVPTKTNAEEHGCCFGDCEQIQLYAVECSLCKKNFCLTHRYPESHSCSGLHENTYVNKKATTAFEKLKGSINATNGKPPNSEVQSTAMQKSVKKTFTKEQQAKLDRLAVMRFKLNAKNIGLDEEERLFLIVEEGDERKPVLVSKNWSIGKCVDHIVKHTSFYGESSLGFRLFKEGRQSFTLSENAGKRLNDMDVIYLRKEDQLN